MPNFPAHATPPEPTPSTASSIVGPNAEAKPMDLFVMFRQLIRVRRSMQTAVFCFQLWSAGYVRIRHVELCELCALALVLAVLVLLLQDRLLTVTLSQAP